MNSQTNSKLIGHMGQRALTDGYWTSWKSSSSMRQQGLLCVYACVCVCVCVHFRGQLAGICSLLLPHGSWGLTSICQAWPQAFIATSLHGQHLYFFFLTCILQFTKGDLKLSQYWSHTDISQNQHLPGFCRGRWTPLYHKSNTVGIYQRRVSDKRQIKYMSMKRIYA